MKKIAAVMFAFVLLFLLAACSSVQDAPAETTVPEAPMPTETTPETADTQPTETAATESTTAPTEVEETIPEPEPAAQRITDGVSVYLGAANQTGMLCDGSHYSKCSVTSQLTLRIESESPFSALYIEWDSIPGAYTLEWDGGSQDCGEYDFLHEYIRLPEAVNAVQFVFQDDSAKLICEVELYTAGSTPEGVQDWLPPCEQADILVFPTHSDDDVLFFGPLISYYAIERGLTVQTAFMVDHTWQKERSHERLNGLWEMGIRHYPILGSAPDTGSYDMYFGMSYYADSDIPGWQIEQIRRFQPLVVVGHDLKGEYGNAGHKVNSYYLIQSIEDAANPDIYPESAEKYGVWDTPKLYLHLYEENEWYFDVNTPMVNDPEGRTPFEVAEDAFLNHVSQRKGSLHVQQEDDARIWDCRPFGLYRSLVGEDTTADVMDNINPEDWR